MKKIVYITGTRADYGIMSDLLKKLNQTRNFNVKIIATGMHLMKKFGSSINEIKKDDLEVIKINSIFRGDKASSMLYFLSDFIEKLTKELERLKPDFIFVLGDRIEMLGAAIVGSYLATPVVHFHGGEVSSTIDETARHAITKLSHLHFCATEKSAERIIRMGEEKFRVKVVGAPSLNNISRIKKISKKEMFRKFGLDVDKPLVLVLQHPVTLQESKSYSQMHNILIAVEELGHQALVIYPNSDPGSSKIIECINKFRFRKNLVIRKNISRDLFISLMSHANVLVGNSSSGIIEAPQFKLPVVNIGARQNGRERAKNAIDCIDNKNLIKKSIEYALSSAFKNKIKNIKNPYNKGNTFESVFKTLKKIKINEKLLQKNLAY